MLGAAQGAFCAALAVLAVALMAPNPAFAPSLGLLGKLEPGV